MVEETITQIEERIKKAKSLNDERKKELLDLLSTLKTEVFQLSKTDAEDAQSIIGFTEISIHEAIREEKHPQLLNISLKGLSTAVKRFENSHPKLVGIVNSICNTLSNIGIWKKRQGLQELRIMNQWKANYFLSKGSITTDEIFKLVKSIIIEKKGLMRMVQTTER